MQRSTEIFPEDPELSATRIPPRSRLYPVVPVGVGTPDTESLTSYITRLADAHCVTTKALVLRELFPRLNKPYLQKYGPGYLSTFWKTQSPRLNGISNTTEDWVNLMQSLTLCDQLSALTFLPWRSALGRRQLLRSTKAWCPVCYDEWKNTGTPLHDSLLWTLEAVKICPRHLQVLREYCPAQQCGRRQSVLSATARAGYCSHCGSWLGGNSEICVADKSVQDVETLKWHSWVATSIGELISAAPSLPSGSSVSRNGGLAGLAICLAFVGGNSYLRLSEILKVSPKALRSWARRGSRPNIGILLRLSFSLGVSFKALLMDDRNCDYPQKLRTVPVSARSVNLTSSRRLKPRIVKIQKRLEKFAAGGEFPPPSVNQASMRLGCDNDALRRRFPEQCASIAIRYHDFVQARKQQRRQEICQRIKTIVSGLRDNGIYPSARRVQGLLNSTTDFRDPELRETWQRAKKAVDGALNKKLRLRTRRYVREAVTGEFKH